MRTDESGFGLIEVLVTALLVATVSLGVMAMFDSASATSRQTRARSQASALAQQDQDRLRASSPAALSALAGTSSTVTKAVGGVQFAVKTTVAWATDGTTGAASCTGANPPSYLKVTSEVTGGGLPSSSTVRSTSIVAMPVGSTGGTLRVNVKDSANVGVDGATVTLTGTTSRTATTTSGCAIFSALPVGSYDVQVTKSGYLDVNGSDTSTQLNQGVFAGQVTDVNFTITRAATLTATFWTYANSTRYATQADRLVVTNSSAPTRKFGTPRGAGNVNLQSSIVTTGGDGSPSSPGLYPFSTAYGISAGDCTAEQNFLTYSPALVLSPGGNMNVDIPLNAVDVTIKWNGSALPAGTHARVWLKRNASSSPTCTAVQYPPVTSFRFTGDNQDHMILGVPAGTYDLCAEYTSGTTTYIKTYSQSPGAVNVAKTTSATANPSGEKNMSASLSTSSTVGTCPQ